MNRKSDVGHLARIFARVIKRRIVSRAVSRPQLFFPCLFCSSYESAARLTSAPPHFYPSRATLCHAIQQADVYQSVSRSAKQHQYLLNQNLTECGSAAEVLEIVGAEGHNFNAVNAVTAVYKIARCLVSRAGRLMKKVRDTR